MYVQIYLHILCFTYTFFFFTEVLLYLRLLFFLFFCTHVLVFEAHDMYFGSLIKKHYDLTSFICI